jgi:hypothetical protein
LDYVLQGAQEHVFMEYNFTYSPDLTPALTSVNPKRGSTEGGTKVTLSGTFPELPLEAITISIAGFPCTNISQENATSIACITSAPYSNETSPASRKKPQGPQRVRLNFADRGDAEHVNNRTVAYEYVDLWSRQTTWGGNPPPVDGDSVLVPANATVLLDVSPPVLYAVVLEGNLVFDDEATEELHLQVRVSPWPFCILGWGYCYAAHCFFCHVPVHVVC